MEMQTMLLPKLATVALLASMLPLGARAQDSGDPTFNGLVARANCQVRIVNVCQSQSCVQVLKGCQGDLCGSLVLLFKYKQFAFGSMPKMPLQITGIAPAEVGKALWVKFLLPMKEGTVEGRFTLKPNSFGGYAGSAVVSKAADNDPTGNSFTLVDYDCEQIPDGP